CLTAVNDCGLAVGGFRTADEIGSYLWNGSSVRTLPIEIANAINAAGTVAGAMVVIKRPQSGAVVFSSHAALWTAETGAQDLNDIADVPSGVELTGAVAMNDAGSIVANALRGAFLPVPR